jgi:ABC-type sugar transport system permease subunit
MLLSRAAPAQRSPLSRLRALGNEIYRCRISYLFVLPGMALAVLFSYYPAFLGLLYAFTNWQPGLSQIDFVGLENFRLMTEDRFLHAGVRNLAVLLVATIGKYLTVPFLVALIIYHIRPLRAQYWLRTLFVTPLVVPTMATMLLWGQIYHPSTGLINNLLGTLGLAAQTRPWLGDPHTALAAIIFIGFPWVVVLPFLIYLGGLMNIPSDVIDAARIDGATPWRRLWSIEIPLLKPQFKICGVLGFIFQMQGFWFILVLTGGGPLDATYTPALEMYYAAFRFGKYGYASAIALALFVVIMIGTVLNLTLVKSSVEYEA